MSRQWVKVDRTGVAKFPFKQNGRNQIALKAKDRVRVAEECAGWYRGLNCSTNETGIFPANYVELLKHRPRSVTAAVNSPSKPASTSPTFKRGTESDPLFRDVQQALFTWGAELRKAQEDQNAEEESTIKLRIFSLSSWWSRLCAVHAKKGTPKSEDSSLAVDLRQAIIKLIESSRHISEAYIVPRKADDDIQADETNSSIVCLQELHHNMFAKLEEGMSLPQTAEAFRDFEVEKRIRDGSAPSPVKPTEEWVRAHRSLSVDGVSSLSALATAEAARVSLGKPKLSGEKYHILLEVKAALFSVGEPTAVYISLYSATKERFLTEQFLVHLATSGLPLNIDHVGQLKTLFQDLSLGEILEQSLVVVCHVYRMGSLVVKKKGKQADIEADQVVRMLIGYCALPLDPLLAQLPLEKEGLPEHLDLIFLRNRHDFPVYLRHVAGLGSPEDGRVMDRMDLVKSHALALGLLVLKGNIRTLRNAASASVTRLLKEVAPPMGITQRLHVHDTAEEHGATSQLSTLDPMAPPRNDIYFTLKSCTVAQDKKIAAKNVEVRVYVMQDSGECLQCLMCGTGMQQRGLQDCFRSAVEYHNNTPTFNDTFAVRMPAEVGRFERLHLLITLHHVSTSKKKSHVFAFGWLPLCTANGVLLPDGEHRVSTFKPLLGMDAGPVLPKYLQSKKTGIVERRDSILIQSQLCSTTETQLEALHSLINWRMMESTALHEALHTLEILPLDHLLRFLKHILDPLFDLLSHQSKPDTVTAGFGLLVCTLSRACKVCAHEDREGEESCQQHSVKTMVLSYIHHIFLESRAYLVLLRLLRDNFRWLLGNVATSVPDVRRLRIITAALHSFPWLMDFVVTSRLQEVKSGSVSVSGTEYKSSIHEVIVTVLSLLSAVSKDGSTAPVWVWQIQAVVLQNIPETFRVCAPAFTAQELGKIGRACVEAVPNSATHLRFLQLLFILELCNAGVLEKFETRKAMIASIVRLLQFHLQMDPSPMFFLALEIVLNLCKLLQESASACDDDSWNLSILLPELIRAVRLLLPIHRDRLAAIRKVPTPQWLETVTVGRHPPLLKLLASDIALPAMAIVHEPRLPDQVQKDLPSKCLPNAAVSLMAIVYTLKAVHVSPSNIFRIHAWQMKHYFKAVVSDTEELAQLLRNTFSIIRQLCAVEGDQKTDLFPKQWLLMRRLLHRTLSKLLQWFSSPLLDSFLSLATSDIRTEDSLWKGMFSAGIALLVYVTEELHDASDAKRQFWLGTGSSADSATSSVDDKREQVCVLLVNLYNRLPRSRAGMAETMVDPLLKFATLNPRSDTAKRTLASLGKSLYVDMIRLEFQKTKRFERAEQYTLDCVDRLIKSKMQSGEAAAWKVRREAFLQLFSKHLPAKFKKDPVLRSDKAVRFLSDAGQFFNLLDSVSAIPHTPEYEIECSEACLQLLRYLKSSHRRDLFIKHVDELYSLHDSLGNHEEAGYTLLLHADALQWDSVPCGDDPRAGFDLLAPFQHRGVVFPEQLECERREAVYELAARHFEKGLGFEAAISTYQTLSERARTVTHDRARVVSLLSRQMALHSKMMEQAERVYPNYFLVSFVGNGFPAILANAEFVYKGDPYERIGEFERRLLCRYSSAKKLAPGRDATEEEEAGKEQFIRVSTVNPTSVVAMTSPQMTPAVIPGLMECCCKCPPQTRRRPGVLCCCYQRRVPPMIAKNRSFSDISAFCLPHPFKKRPKEERGDLEFLETWLVRRYYKIEGKLPGTRRRCRVVERRDVVMNPLENGVASLQAKYNELETEIAKASLLEGRTAGQPFTMLLNGVVDAAVNGGIKNFETFLTGAYVKEFPHIRKDLKEHPEKQCALPLLKRILRKQLRLLYDGIIVHSEKCMESMLPLHDHMMGRFQEMIKLLHHAGINAEDPDEPIEFPS